MIVNVHDVQGKKIVTVVDSNLIGKKIIENNFQLDLTSDFYKGDEKTEEELEKLIPRSYVIHLVGKESISWGIKNDIIGKENIIIIKNIPHAEVLFL